jgi:hypothetical protein
MKISSVSHILLKGLHEFLPMLYKFLDWFGRNLVQIHNAIQELQVCKNWCSENHTLLINELLPYFLCFLANWMTLGRGDVHSNLSIDYAIYKIRAVKATLYMGSKGNFNLYFPHYCTFTYCKFSTKNLHIMLFSISELHEKQHKDGNMFYGCKKCLDNVRVSCHDVPHMQPCLCMLRIY